MRVQIVEEIESSEPAAFFPPAQKYVDLRANPKSTDQIAGARKHLPLWNFLAAVNGAESIFMTARTTTKSDVPASVPADRAYEFASQSTIVFADPELNWDHKNYAELAFGLKELLERETGDTVRAVLLISSCDFADRKRRGFCLGIRLVAEGESAQQAETRWGLGLARVQQALLFRSRALNQLARN
jgi:hypothetical protein